MYQQTVPIVQAQKADKKDLKRFYKAQRYHANFMGFDHGYLIKNKHEIIGAVLVSYLIENNRLGFLHGLCVDKNHQNQGLASSLILQCQKFHSQLLCFSQAKLANWYRAHHFKTASTDSIPQVLLDNYQSYLKKDSGVLTWLYNNESLLPLADNDEANQSITLRTPQPKARSKKQRKNKQLIGDNG